MDLIPTDDQRAIREQAVRLLADKASSEAVRKVIESGRGVDAELWSAISGELGWCGMAVREEHGGLGLGITELLILAESVGERLAPVPLWSTMCVAAPLLETVCNTKAKRRYLPRIAAGEFAATVAFARLDTPDPLSSTAVAAVETDDGWELTGEIASVVDIGIASLVLVPAFVGETLALFALEGQPGEAGRLLETVDGTRQWGALKLDRQKLPADNRIDMGGISPDLAEAAMATAQLGLAAEQIGAARGVMDLTLEYIGDRVQFGRTIASFQAIKHRCALLEVEYAEAKALVYGAAASFLTTTAEDRKLEAAGARALATDLLFHATEEAVQLHGGVGCTWEYDVQLYLKRAQATASLLGTAERHRNDIAAHFLSEETAA